jgi:serine/threonine-protein kinase
MTLWWIAAVLLSWFASHIVYGLRREVHSAMRLGQYTLDERIGEGAMGVVYRARHALLKRPTAVKVLRPERASEIDVARFEREVQLTSQLTHPNTVKVYDYGRTEDGLLYYAMELVDGASLQDVVTVGGPQPIGRVIRILLHVASALAEAHDIGLIHRDIKPANILLCFQGGEPDVAKVVDFGLARKLARESGPALTMSNALLGTPLYLAPEAIKAPDTLDGRGDIYALGAVGYFLVTGSDVFDAASVIAVCADHLYQRPESPSKRLGATIPAEVEDLIMTCLRKDPNDRWPDAHALEAALGALADDYRWTRADAESWWAEHGPRLEQLTGKRRIDAPSQPLRPRRRQLRAEGATLLRGWGFGN